MKIVLIGPVYPFKGGISHYTGLLCRALRKNHIVEMISYKMQYPKIMFRKEQRDYENKSFAVEDTQYLINTANPVNIVQTAGKVRRGNPDIVILQWWHPYFAPCYFILTRCIRSKCKVLFVCHNVFPHERFPLDRFLTKMVLRQGDYYVVQSHTDEKDLLGIKHDARYVVTPHPTYNAFKMQNMSKEKARELLQVKGNTNMLLFFGFVREYKGLKYLLNAMPVIREEISDIQLWVVGDFGKDKEEYTRIIDENSLWDMIQLVEGYVPDQEVEKYFAAADMVVLPYRSATQSGIAQIAYGFEKPVVVTDVGGLPDVVEEGKTGYVVPKDNAGALAEAVIRFFGEDKGKAWEENIRKAADKFSWETMVRKMEELWKDEMVGNL